MRAQRRILTDQRVGDNVAGHGVSSGSRCSAIGNSRYCTFLIIATPPGFKPSQVKAAVDAWTTAAGISEGRVFRAINKAGRIWGDGMSPKVLWDVVRVAAARAGIDKLAPHDLRRTCARLCHLAGGELEQIQFLLGHVSVQTTERYLGCKQKLRCAVNDRLGIEPNAAA